MQIKYSQILYLVILIGTLASCARSQDKKSLSTRELYAYKVQKTTSGFKDQKSPENTKLTAQSTVEDYLKIALENNLELKAAFHNWRSMYEKTAQTSALPDPRITLGYDIEEVETRVGAQKWSVAISQKTPWFGKLNHKEKSSFEMALSEKEKYESKRLEILFKVKKAYNEYYYLKRSIDLTQENIQLLKIWEKILQDKYSAGNATYSGLLKTQVELEILNDRLVNLNKKQKPLSAHLASLLNKPHLKTIPFPQLASQATRELDKNNLLDLIEKSNHELKSLRHKIKSNEHTLKFANINKFPDPTFSLKHIETDRRNAINLRDNGKDPLIASLSFNVPFGKNYGSAIQEARQRKLRTQSILRNRTLSLKSDLEASLFDFDEAKRKAVLYKKNLIPKIEQTLEVSQAEYQSGKVDYLNVLEAQRTLLEFYLTKERALIDQATSLAKIEMLVGQSLSKETKEVSDD